MKTMQTATLMILGLAIATAGCKKDDKNEASDENDEKTETPEAPPEGETGPDEQPEEEPDEQAGGEATGPDGSITILASHSDPKPDDPVEVRFPAFEVVKAEFDPENLEGGTAEIHVDLTKLESGSAKRDKHLRSEDYLEVEKFGIAKVLVSDVKKGEEDGVYEATATVDIHGVEVEWPVTFEVVETMADGIKVKASHEFLRKDFGVGADEGDSVAQKLELQLELVLKSS